MAAYPEHADAIRSKLTPRGEDLLFKVQDQCVAETIAKFMFRHLQPYFNEDIHELVNEEPFSGLFDEQKLGRFKPNAPVMILSNRFDPLVPWTGANQLGRDWCAQGRRRPVLDQRGAAVPQQGDHQPRTADVGRRRAGHAVDRRPVQRTTDHTQLRRVLGRRGARVAAAVLDVRQRLPDARKVGLRLRVRLHVRLDLRLRLVARQPFEAVEEVVHVGMIDKVLRLSLAERLP